MKLFLFKACVSMAAFFCIHLKQQQLSEKEVAAADWKNKQKHKGMAHNGLKSFFEVHSTFFIRK